MKRFLASMVLAFGLAVSGAASAQFTQLIVFGDSLSDPGNVFAISGSPPAPYFGGRFSNGLVWAEVAASTWGIPITNYAHGGALTGVTNSNNAVNPTGMTGSVYDAGFLPATGPQPGAFPFPGALSQVLAYATGVQIFGQTMDPTTPGAIVPDPGALYVVFAGGNDFLALTQPPQVLGAFGASLGLDPFDPNFQSDLGLALINLGLTNLTSSTPINFLGGAVQAPAGAIPLLYGLGARNIAVVNLPDLSLTPAAAAQGPAIQGAFAQLVANYNSFLAAALNSLQGALPGVNIIQIDAGALLRNAVADPASFGLTNVTDSCVDTLCFLSADPNTYLFWDGIHPTATVHQVLAMEIMQKSEASMQPPAPPPMVPVTIAPANGGSGASGPLTLMLGLLLWGLAGRRRTLH